MRTILNTKIKNEIEKEIKKINPNAKVTMNTTNVGEGFLEAEKGKMKCLYVDIGTRYIPTGADNEENNKERKRLLCEAFAILEKYNKNYKFDYMVDKKKFKSDGTNFHCINKSVLEI